MISKEEHEKRMSLYNQGLNDREIGKRLYLSASAVRYWRRWNGLPANKTYWAITPEMDAEMRKMHQTGESDLAIARKMGLAKGTVYSWRCRKGLPTNFKRGGQPIHERRSN